MSFSRDIDQIKQIVQRIEERTDKGDIKFICAELQEKLSDLKKYSKSE